MVAMTESDRNIVLVLHALGKEAVGKDLTIARPPINGPATRFCPSRIITAGAGLETFRVWRYQGARILEPVAQRDLIDPAWVNLDSVARPHNFESEEAFAADGMNGFAFGVTPER
jgi:hypothetical protein